MNVESISALRQISNVPYHKTQMRTLLVQEELEPSIESMGRLGSSSRRPQMLYLYAVCGYGHVHRL